MRNGLVQLQVIKQSQEKVVGEQTLLLAVWNQPHRALSSGRRAAGGRAGEAGDVVREHRGQLSSGLFGTKTPISSPLSAMLLFHWMSPVPFCSTGQRGREEHASRKLKLKTEEKAYQQT